MKRNSTTIFLLLAIFLLIVGLNFVFLVDEQGEQESEQTGSRSSYRATPFGTLAFYTLLERNGYAVTRFEKALTKLNEQPAIGTLVIIAPPFISAPGQEELEALNSWVEKGKLLVIIDRQRFVTLNGAQSRMAYNREEFATRPLQPTLYSEGVEQIKLSPFASRVTVESESTIYHYGDDKGAVLASANIGAGRVLWLTDPYLVANNGIAEADNVLLALNLFNQAPAGSIAFDEYHHGYNAASAEGVMAYFEGKPVKWMFWQMVLITALLVYTYGRRFARPLPLRRESRTTNLEFVSSMANITRLAKASDLAMQNIYSDFRTKLCRYSGLPARTDSPRLAAVAARRMQGNERDLRNLLAKCEKVVHGEPTSDAELLKLVTRIREIESKIRI